MLDDPSTAKSLEEKALNRLINSENERNLSGKIYRLAVRATIVTLQEYEKLNEDPKSE